MAVYLIDPALRPEPITDGCNPLLAKEQLTNPLFRSAWRWRCFYITITLVLLAFLVACPLLESSRPILPRGSWYGGLDDVLLLMWLLSLGVAAGWAALTHAVAFAGEQEGGTIETLKLTRLTAGEFLRSKWLICWKLRWPYIVIMLALFVFLTCYRMNPVWISTAVMRGAPDPFSAPLLSLLLIEATAITATRAALFAKTIRHALLWTFGIILLILLIPYWTRQITFSQRAGYTPMLAYMWNYTERLTSILVIWTFACGMGIWFHIHRLWRHDE